MSILDDTFCSNPAAPRILRAGLRWSVCFLFTCDLVGFPTSSDSFRFFVSWLFWSTTFATAFVKSRCCYPSSSGNILITYPHLAERGATIVLNVLQALIFVFPDRYTCIQQFLLLWVVVPSSYQTGRQQRPTQFFLLHV